jgi:hypothetical protein
MCTPTAADATCHLTLTTNPDPAKDCSSRHPKAADCPPQETPAILPLNLTSAGKPKCAGVQRVRELVCERETCCAATGPEGRCKSLAQNRIATLPALIAVLANNRIVGAIVEICCSTTAFSRGRSVAQVAMSPKPLYTNVFRVRFGGAVTTCPQKCGGDMTTYSDRFDCWCHSYCRPGRGHHFDIRPSARSTHPRGVRGPRRSPASAPPDPVLHRSCSLSPVGCCLRCPDAASSSSRHPLAAWS